MNLPETSKLWQQRSATLRSSDSSSLHNKCHQENFLQLLPEEDNINFQYHALNFLLDNEIKEFSREHIKFDVPLATSHPLYLYTKKNSILSDVKLPDETSMQQLMTCSKSRMSIVENELQDFGSKKVVGKNIQPLKTSNFYSGSKKSSLSNLTEIIFKNGASTYAHGSSCVDSTIGNKTYRKRKADNQDQNMENLSKPQKSNDFKSAREQLILNQKKKKGDLKSSPQEHSFVKKSLGARPRNTNSNKFIPPTGGVYGESNDNKKTNHVKTSEAVKDDFDDDPRIQGIDPKIIEMISNEIMDKGPAIHWDDIAGLEFAKATIKEIVIWPMLRPDIFTGLRGPAKGILLFGPPGTGKTLIGKCIANQSGATFFSISASSLTSKWVGEGEKMVRGLFAVAGCRQPAVIFIDEIDSLLSQRSDSEHESSRRIKTEFLVQLDGATTVNEDRILVVGATNRPQEIDEAARRRLVKRLYIPLPESAARKQIVLKLLSAHSYDITSEQFSELVSLTDGYSGADMANLCREAALCPIRSLQSMDIVNINKEDVRPISFIDFKTSLKRVRPSVSHSDLLMYEEWNRMFGCCDF